MPRPLGSKNKNHSVRLRERLQEKFGDGWDPVLEMAKLAVELVESAETRHEKAEGIVALEKVAKFTVPQLKAIEVDLSNDDGSLSRPTTVKLVPVRVDQEGREIPYNANEGLTGPSREGIDDDTTERAGDSDTPGDDRRAPVTIELQAGETGQPSNQ